MTLVKTLPPPETDLSEILRYAGVKNTNEEINSLLNSCLEEALPIFSYKVCYLLFSEKDIPHPFNNLSQLNGCTEAVIFAATVGLDIDRLIAKYGITLPSRALMLQAIGAERIESLCNAFQNGFNGTRSRFSPGYGSFPLECQRDIFELLNPPKNIGLSLNSSLLMSPSKSVTAIFGIRR